MIMADVFFVPFLLGIVKPPMVYSTIGGPFLLLSTFHGAVQ